MGSESSSPKKVDECGGNACPNCGKCHDWIYDGNIEEGFECWTKNQKDDRIWNDKNWSRRKGATCTWDRKRHHHYDSTGTSKGERIGATAALGVLGYFMTSGVSFFLTGNGCRCSH